ncbi:MAG: exosome complex RNA-binding protein Csl4 [Nitrososphaerota archaeon]
MKKIEKRIVVPGEKIGVIEEFIGKNGTYINEYEIISNNLGLLNVDYKSKIVKVEPLNKIETIEKSSYVLCEVKEVQNSLIFVDILSVNKRPLKHPMTGIILPLKIKKGKKEEKKSLLSIGDIAIAKVIDNSYGIITLSIKDKECGALLCFCEFCASPLKLNKNLYCKKCKIKQDRKIMKKYYNNFKQILEWFRLK